MSKIYVGETPISAVFMGGKRYGVRVGFDRLLPTGYTQLEYIEATGTQYIDTGITGGTNAAYEIKLNTLGSEFIPYEPYFGGDSDQLKPPKLIGGGGLYAQVLSNAREIASLADEIHTVEYRINGDVYLDGSKATNFSNAAGLGWGDFAWRVFRNFGSTPRYSTCRLWYLKMWTDSVLVRNFIPAKRNSDNKIGLYDTVSKTFFTDVNGGNFVGGDPV